MAAAVQRVGPFEPTKEVDGRNPAHPPGFLNFTPAPWQARDDYTRDGSLTIIGDIDGEYFTDSPSPSMSYEFVASLEDEYGETHERTAANRRLILAAPELVEFIAWVAGSASGQHADPLDTLKHIESQARAMLAKVGG